jgi:hypothetical protein
MCCAAISYLAAHKLIPKLCPFHQNNSLLTEFMSWTQPVTCQGVVSLQRTAMEPEARSALPFASVHVNLETFATRHSVLTHRLIRQQANFSEFGPDVAHTSAGQPRARLQ